MTLGSILTTGIIANQITDYRFKQYVSQSYQVRMDQIKSLIVELYENNGGWGNRTILLRGQGMMIMLIKVVDNKGRTVLRPRHSFNSTQVNIVTQPLINDGIKIGVAYFGIPKAQLLFTPQDILFRRAITESVLFAGLIIAAVTLYLAFWLAKGLTAPIRAINRTAMQMTEGNLAVRVERLPNDEIGELGSSLNLLAEKLQQLDALRQKMTADVAHDLRTPLSIIRSHLEAIRDRVIPPAPQNIASILEETLRLIGLVDSLQQIAQTDQVLRQIDNIPFNLDDLLHQVYQSMRPLFTKKAICFSYESSFQQAVVHSDPHALHHILTNLLENAYKYTPTQKEVRLILGENPLSWLIAVEDKGEGIPPDDLPFIFERFYRVDRARNRETGGFGLGLTIVKELVQALGGKIEVQSRLGEGTRFTVYLDKNL